LIRRGPAQGCPTLFKLGKTAELVPQHLIHEKKTWFLCLWTIEKVQMHLQATQTETQLTDWIKQHICTSHTQIERTYSHKELSAALAWYLVSHAVSSGLSEKWLGLRPQEHLTIVNREYEVSPTLCAQISWLLLNLMTLVNWHDKISKSIVNIAPDKYCVRKKIVLFFLCAQSCAHLFITWGLPLTQYM